MVGVFTDEPLRYGEKLEESTNTINYRTVEERKIIDLEEEELSEEFQETYAQQVFEEKDVSKDDLMTLLEITSR